MSTVQMRESFTPRIMITGENGGTGSSTLARMLSDLLELPCISAGGYVRALSHQFCRRLEESGQPLAQFTSDFNQMYTKQYRGHGIAGVLALLSPDITTPSNGVEVKAFTSAIATYLPNESRLWDTWIDCMTLQEAVGSNNGFVWEGKLTIIADRITEIQKLLAVGATPLFAGPVIRILLTADHSVAAARIAKREAVAANPDEVARRQARDFRRFAATYTIGDRPIELADLRRHADHIEATDALTSSEVLHRIVAMILQKLDALKFTPPAALLQLLTAE